MAYRHTTRRHRGFTLTELLLVSGMITVILALIGVSMTTMLRMNNNIRHRQVHLASLARLADTWREDIRAATDVTSFKVGDEQIAKVSLPDELTVLYLARSDELVRTAYTDNKPVQVEQFAMAEGFWALCFVGQIGLPSADLILHDPLGEAGPREVTFWAAMSKEAAYGEP